MNTVVKPEYSCFNHESIPRLGMGCWAIGGPFYRGDEPLGYGVVDDQESTRAIHAACDAGVRYFDTAAAYGCGHSERVLGEALAGRHDIFISTKLGHHIDEQNKQLLPAPFNASDVDAAIDASLARLQRERIDLLFLHLNELPLADADNLFGRMDTAIAAGKIASYGWSTDFTASAQAMAERQSFVAVQHVLNVFFPAPSLLPVLEQHGLLSINRSPLAMGLLSGKFNQSSSLPDNDVRSGTNDTMDWFKHGRVAPGFLQTMDAIRECLQCGGRTLTQGALSWILAKSSQCLPIPGFRTVAQVVENTRALELGPLPESVMIQIEQLIDRTNDDADRAR